MRYFHDRCGGAVGGQGWASPVPCHCRQEWHHPSVRPSHRPGPLPNRAWLRLGRALPSADSCAHLTARETRVTKIRLAFLLDEFSTRSRLPVRSEKRGSPAEAAAAGPGRKRRWGRSRSSYFSCSQISADLAVSHLYTSPNDLVYLLGGFFSWCETTWTFKKMWVLTPEFLQRLCWARAGVTPLGLGWLSHVGSCANWCQTDLWKFYGKPQFWSTFS